MKNNQRKNWNKTLNHKKPTGYKLSASVILSTQLNFRNGREFSEFHGSVTQLWIPGFYYNYEFFDNPNQALK